ncbi:Phosphoenolpyruvate carboxylase [Trifolium repens]|nr:Phosphoenolpyruvate carboxylase [Trifolium repens]
MARLNQKRKGKLLLLSSPLHSVKNASSLSLRYLSPAATSGEETFDFDFCISRQSACNMRQAGIEDMAELLEKQLASEFSKMSLEEAQTLARAFSHYLTLMGITETHHRVRKGVNMAKLAKSCDHIFCQLLQDGISPDDLFNTVCKQAVAIVLTAHPTQINRRTLQFKHIKIAMFQALDRDQLEQQNAATSATPWTYLNTWDNRSSRSSLLDGLDSLEEGGLRASSSYSSEINEQDNDKAIDTLHDRVSFLKRLTGDIHEVVESHNSMLDRVGNKMDGSKGYDVGNHGSIQEALSASPHHSHATLSSLTSKAPFPLNIQPNHHMQTQFHHHCATKRRQNRRENTVDHNAEARPQGYLYAILTFTNLFIHFSSTQNQPFLLLLTTPTPLSLHSHQKLHFHSIFNQTTTCKLNFIIIVLPRGDRTGEKTLSTIMLRRGRWWSNVFYHWIFFFFEMANKATEKATKNHKLKHLKRSTQHISSLMMQLLILCHQLLGYLMAYILILHLI